MAQEIFITGYHAIDERLITFKTLPQGSCKNVSLYYSASYPRVNKLLSLSKECGIKCILVESNILDLMVKDLPQNLKAHRGAILVIKENPLHSLNFTSLETYLHSTKEEGGKDTVLILDGITDTHNIGAVIRSAVLFNVRLVILGEKKGVSAATLATNSTIYKASAGSINYINLCITPNLSIAVNKLKEAGFWIYAADIKGDYIQEVTFPNKTAFILGSEGQGIARLLKKNCDQIVTIPTTNKIDSLNVSVACGVLLYERYRQTLKV